MFALEKFLGKINIKLTGSTNNSILKLVFNFLNIQEGRDGYEPICREN